MTSDRKDGTKEHEDRARAIAPVLSTLSKYVRAVARRCLPDADDRHTLYATLGAELIARSESMMLALNPDKKDSVRALTEGQIARMREYFQLELSTAKNDLRAAEGGDIDGA